MRDTPRANPTPAAEWVKTVPLDCPHVEARELYVCHACMAANLDAFAREQVEAAHEADAQLLEDLARDMKEDGSREQRALMKGAIAAYKSGAAAIRALVP